MTGVRGILAGIGAAIALTAGAAPIAWEAANPAPTATPLTGYNDPRLTRNTSEPTLDYVRRATRNMAEAVEHSDADDPTQTWEVAVARTITGGQFTAHEDILDPAHIRRGLCGQHSAILAETMRRNGIDSADAYQIDGHVVVEFTHNNQTWLTDPDIGVGPYPIDWDKPRKLETTAQTVYAAAPAPYDAAWITPILADTTNDSGAYPRSYLTSIATHQQQALDSVTTGRWILLAVGLLLIWLAMLKAPSDTRSRQTRASLS